MQNISHFSKRQSELTSAFFEGFTLFCEFCKLLYGGPWWGIATIISFARKFTDSFELLSFDRQKCFLMD